MQVALPKHILLPEGVITVGSVACFWSIILSRQWPAQGSLGDHLACWLPSSENRWTRANQSLGEVYLCLVLLLYYKKSHYNLSACKAVDGNLFKWILMSHVRLYTLVAGHTTCNISWKMSYTDSLLYKVFGKM